MPVTQGFLDRYVRQDRVNDEPPSDFRPVFAAELAPRLGGLSQTEAALEVNLWCAEHVTYRFNDSPTADPLTTYYRGHGRCGEESVFTVAALRAAGLPARQVYVPRWSHCDDNHAWVEVFADGAWRYLGACEPEPVLDRGWFTAPARRAMLVRGRGVDGGYENLTARYAPTQLWRFHTPLPGGKLTLWVLNGGAFHPIWTTKTDAHGDAALELGRGDLLATVEAPGAWGELLCKGKEGREFTLPPGRPTLDPNLVLRFEAPDPPPDFPPPLTPAQQRRREELLAQAAQRRALWTAAHRAQAHAPDRPGGQGFDPPLMDRSVAATRLPCGDQLFVMGPAGAELTPPAAAPEELLRPQPMPFAVAGPRLLAWVRPGEEPTAHFLGELAALDGPFPVPVETRTDPPPADLPRVLGLDPDSLPLLVLVGSDGRCHYAGGGYQVGSAALLKLLASLLT